VNRVTITILTLLCSPSLLAEPNHLVMQRFVQAYSHSDVVSLAGCFASTATHNGRRIEDDIFAYDREFKSGSREMVLSDVVVSPGGTATAWVDIDSPRGRCSGPVDFEFNRSGYIQNMWSNCSLDSPTADADMALIGQSADLATTAVGLAAGMAEANPIMAGPGLPVALVVKLGVSEYAETLPTADCRKVKNAATFAGWGAAGWNLCVLATAGSGGAAAPVCAALGLMAGTAVADASDTSNVRICRRERPGERFARIDRVAAHR